MKVLGLEDPRHQLSGPDWNRTDSTSKMVCRFFVSKTILAALSRDGRKELVGLEEHAFN